MKRKSMYTGVIGYAGGLATVLAYWQGSTTNMTLVPDSSVMVIKLPDNPTHTEELWIAVQVEGSKVDAEQIFEGLWIDSILPPVLAPPFTPDSFVAFEAVWYQASVKEGQ